MRKRLKHFINRRSIGDKANNADAKMTSETNPSETKLGIL